MEGKWIRKVFAASLEDKGLREPELNAALMHLDILLSIFGGAGLCLSEQRDLLSQWRGYANNGSGLAIGFDKDAINMLANSVSHQDFGFTLEKVIYDLESQKNSMNKETNSVYECISNGALQIISPSLIRIGTPEAIEKQNRAFNDMRLYILSSFKHIFILKNPAFYEEKEWRLLSLFVRRGKQNDEGMLKMMDFRCVDSAIVPYVEIPLVCGDINPVNQVVIGPKNTTPSDIISSFLDKEGFHNTKVHTSAASYR